MNLLPPKNIHKIKIKVCYNCFHFYYDVCGMCCCGRLKSNQYLWNDNCGKETTYTCERWETLDINEKE